MIYPNDPIYNIGKPPVMLAQRIEKFQCVVCERPGEGPPNSRAHPGACRAELTRRKAKAWSTKNRQRKQAMRLAKAS